MEYVAVYGPVPAIAPLPLTPVTAVTQVVPAYRVKFTEPVGATPVIRLPKVAVSEMLVAVPTVMLLVGESWVLSVGCALLMVNGSVPQTLLLVRFDPPSPE